MPPKLVSARIARSDLHKRKELFLEFLYYIFDSVLIPLVRSNFHVTESSLHRNRLFYFRHDIWRQLTEPSLASLKVSMFEEVRTTQAKKLLDARVLGFSQIRLLPKGNGIRPITNLRRRIAKVQNGKAILGRSINSILAPIFNMFDYEKKQQPSRLGSALFSVGEMYPKLKAFRNRLQLAMKPTCPIYFVKVDVQSCFDTIPQRQIIELMETVASMPEYRIARHVEIKSSNLRGYSSRTGQKPVATRRFIATARATSDFQTFRQAVAETFAKGKKDTVFVETVAPPTQRRESLLGLLAEHVENNIVKIGKKFFRQKAGIPQGSVLSSLLCNYFYGELENEYLGFLNDDESILLRLIDDFLLITTNQDHARRFSQIMHCGLEKYGVQVNPVKSLTNFQITVDQAPLPRLRGSTGFPYCGNIINTKTLEITKDIERRKNTGPKSTSPV